MCVDVVEVFYISCSRLGWQWYCMVSDLQWASLVCSFLCCVLTGLSDTSEDDCASCIIVTSPGEVPDITDKLSKSGDLHLIRVSGAGYKFLCVIEGLAACSINSKSCTYAWDTCGPHGVLRSMGGGAISYKDAMQSDNCDSMAQLSYRPKSPEYAKHVHCHGNGLITYKSVTALETVLRTLKS